MGDGAICNEDDGLSWFARVSIEAGGIGAVVMTDGDPSILEDILTTMASMTEVPLSSLDHTWMPMQQTMEDVSPDSIKDREFHVTDDIVLVRGGTLNFTVWGNTIECFDPMCPVDVQFPWETVPHRRHSSWVEVPDLYTDRNLITDAQFATFLTDSGWAPRDKANFLRHWDEIEDPETSQRPVTWVSAWDAAAYCAWQGARLPHSWEWQWIAQGTTGYGWPWGNELDDNKMPEFTSGNTLPLAEPVGGYPEGASWCGVEDLVGYVYQWTNVFSDLHTSRAVLRGAPRWRPHGRDMLGEGHWYQPLPYGAHFGEEEWSTLGPLFEQNTMLLMSDSYDRSGGIGFRCVADVA